MYAAEKPQERRWYVRVDDHVDGPHPESRIREWLREGRLPDDVLLSEDCRTWRPVKVTGSGTSGS